MYNQWQKFCLSNQRIDELFKPVGDDLHLLQHASPIDRGVDPLFGLGGGGCKSKKNLNYFFCVKLQYKILRMERAAKFKIVYV